MINKFSFLGAVHTNMVEIMYEQYIKNPESVNEEWRNFLQVLISLKKFTLKKMKYQKPLRKNFKS